MEESVKQLTPYFPHLGKKRTDSHNRPASDIMMDDIINMFKAFDSVKDQKIPRFMCDEAAGSMMTVMENMASQQSQIQQTQENMCSM